MTTLTVMQGADQFRALVGIPCAALPLTALVCRWLHGKGNGARKPWKYIYSLLVYSASVPSIFVAVIFFYFVFYTEENVLDYPWGFILPAISMLLTLPLVRWNISFKETPGVNSLPVLILTIMAGFALALVIYHRWLGNEHAPNFEKLFLLSAVIFGLLKAGAHLAFRARAAPRPTPPEMPRLQ